MSSPFMHPLDEQPVIAWIKAARLSYYPDHEKLIIEIVIQREGKEVIARSLTLFLDDVNKGAIQLFERIASDFI